jgi:hypothetical protein
MMAAGAFNPHIMRVYVADSFHGDPVKLTAFLLAGMLAGASSAYLFYAIITVT